jgi:tellurite resistance protein
MKDQADKDFINSAGAVYAWMCAADGVVTTEESEGFAKYISDSPFVNSVSAEEFKEAFSDLALIFENDFDEGYAKTLARIKPFKENRQTAINLVKVARQALVADGKLEEVEENIIRELCTFFDIEESQVV